MTPLKLDKYVRCVKQNSEEEWFAFSSMMQTWFPISLEKAEWILSMTPAFMVDTVIAWCRENSYSAVLKNSSGEFVFEKSG